MDQFELIEGYFKKEISPEEARDFEQKILTDEEFASEVAFYLSTLAAAKEDQDLDRKERFRKLYEEKGTIQPAVGILRRWWPYAAAAAVLAGIIFSVFLFNNKELPRQLSENYIKENLQTLTIKMGASEDSMQTALNLYNEGKFPEALQHFELIIRNDTANFMAKQYAGITCLRMKQYEPAIGYFEQLQTYTSLHTNPATFYLAITLMERNAEGDRQRARALLQEIVNNHAEGSPIAQRWLTKL